MRARNIVHSFKKTLTCVDTSYSRRDRTRTTCHLFVHETAKPNLRHHFEMNSKMQSYSIKTVMQALINSLDL